MPLPRPLFILPLFIVLLLPPATSAVAGGSSGAASSAPTSDPVDPEIIQALQRSHDPVKGRETYRICRGCHKGDGAGKPEDGYPRLAGQHVEVLVKQMLDVRAGRRDSPRMQPFLSDDVVSREDIGDLAAFLRGLPVTPTPARGDGRDLARGQQLYERDCATCHGRHGEGRGERFYPVVAAQHYPYLRAQTQESRDHGRRNADPAMVKVLRGYSDRDIAAVSDYMSRMAPVSVSRP